MFYVGAEGVSDVTARAVDGLSVHLECLTSYGWLKLINYLQFPDFHARLLGPCVRMTFHTFDVIRLTSLAWNSAVVPGQRAASAIAMNSSAVLLWSGS